MQSRLEFFTKYLRQMNNDHCEHDCSSTVSSEWNNMKISAKMKVVGENFVWKLLVFFMENARSLHTWFQRVIPWNSMNFMYFCYKIFLQHVSKWSLLVDWILSKKLPSKQQLSTIRCQKPLHIMIDDHYWSSTMINFVFFTF